MPRRACNAPTAISARTPRQRPHLRRGRQRDRDRLPRLPRHRPTPMPTCAPRARPRRRRGTDLALLRNADGRAASNGSSASGRRVLIQRSIVDPEPRMGGEPGHATASIDPPCGSPRLQPCFKAARAKLMARSGAETGRYRVRPGRARRRPRPSRRRDGLLHLPPSLDDELRRLPPADRGELEDRRATTTKARRRATSRPTTRRSRATTCSSSAGT